MVNKGFYTSYKKPTLWELEIASFLSEREMYRVE